MDVLSTGGGDSRGAGVFSLPAKGQATVLDADFARGHLAGVWHNMVGKATGLALRRAHRQGDIVVVSISHVRTKTKRGWKRKGLNEAPPPHGGRPGATSLRGPRGTRVGTRAGITADATAAGPASGINRCASERYVDQGGRLFAVLELVDCRFLASQSVPLISSSLFSLRAECQPRGFSSATAEPSRRTGCRWLPPPPTVNTVQRSSNNGNQVAASSTPKTTGAFCQRLHW